ncbi:serine/threonine protein kinase [Saprolegnia diclina VS20]|uniref:Serine/threonine protein kinase n=1 Tax=Saprolegnia diclina (strain VS20) TaxID=1156394 RepID=T0S999_SAPDV|nr:serine/threonine protein kinase [Saprolegnia diclina VS20]EQC39272.1 serine/threonine protein kinase [Saprolegnia diclina VS20]|eukprot:XP_008607333.1 serine/threonine protein kinase [Saprolegnia diclina VS20]
MGARGSTTHCCWSAGAVALASPLVDCKDTLDEQPVTPAFELPVIVASELTVLGTIGNRGRGRVARADFRGRAVAVRFLNEKLTDSFCRYALRVHRLESSNIVALVGVMDPRSYTPSLVTEFMDGGTVEQLVERKHRADEERKALDPSLLDVAIAVADGLTALHGINLVYEHFQPRNVLLNSKGAIKLSDVTSALDFTCEMTMCTNRSESYYWAPEILMHEIDVPTIAANIYSLGILLVELSTLETPYIEAYHKGLSHIKILLAIEECHLTPALRDDCPDWYRELVALCLLSDPTQRPTARDVARALREGSAKPCA